jgi:hypothetical protein
MNKNYFLTILFAASAYLLTAQTIIQETFTISGTYTVPAGVYSLKVECWGAGGGGGRSTNNGEAKGGGGGGAYAAVHEVAVTPGQVIDFIVGVGGTGADGTQAQKDGGDTWFLSTATVLAKGGKGVLTNERLGGLGGAAAQCVGDITYSGGKGGDGDSGSGASKESGSGGGGAGSTGNGGDGNNGTDNDSNQPGGTGTPEFGGDGGNGVGSQNPGGNGLNYGGGGGGAKRGTGALGIGASSQNGGNGASGFIRISYCVAPNNVTLSGDVAICEGENTQISVSADAPAIGTIVYEWQPAASLSAGNIANPTASPDETTIYTLLASINGCFAPEQSLTVTVRPEADIDFQLPATAIINSAAFAEFTNNSDFAVVVYYVLNGTDSLSVNVQANSTATVLINTEDAATLTYEIYSVEYTSAPSCANDDIALFSSIDVIPSTVSINQITAANLKIYPNPVQNTLFIDIENPAMERIHAEIFNSLGVKVYNTAIEAGQNSLSIDVSNFPEGIYFINMNNSGKANSHSFVKIR